jgi:hypothetical protein
MIANQDADSKLVMHPAHDAWLLWPDGHRGHIRNLPDRHVGVCGHGVGLGLRRHTARPSPEPGRMLKGVMLKGVRRIIVNGGALVTCHQQITPRHFLRRRCGSAGMLMSFEWGPGNIAHACQRLNGGKLL